MPSPAPPVVPRLQEEPHLLYTRIRLAKGAWSPSSPSVMSGVCYNQAERPKVAVGFMLSLMRPPRPKWPT